MVPCLDGGLLPGDQPIDQLADRATDHPSNQAFELPSDASLAQATPLIGLLQDWLEQRLASLENAGAFEEAYALRMEMADWLLAEAG